MPDMPLPLRHPETPQAEDSALVQALRSHVAGTPALQLMAELIQRLRDSRFSWWTPEQLRDTWSATRRMTWFAQRPDIRQRITCALTGLRPKAARGKEPEFQAGLIDSVIDDGDVSPDQFESAFNAMELAAYAPVAEMWQQFRERMPWDQDIPRHQELVAWIFDRLLASYSTIEGMTREPILTPYAIRTTIPGKTWHSKLPLEIRVAIDELRFENERAKPGEPFHAVHDLSVATPAIITASIPLRELVCVFDGAEKALGLMSSHGAPAAAPLLRTSETATAIPPRAEVKAPSEPVVAMPSKPEVKAQPQPVVTMPPRAEVRTQSEPGVAVPTRAEVKAPSEPTVAVPPKAEVKAPSEPTAAVPPKAEAKAPSEPTAAVPPKAEVKGPSEPAATMPPRPEVKAHPAVAPFDRIQERTAEPAKAESPKTDVRKPAASLVEKAAERAMEVARQEAPKADVKAPPEKTPDKPAENVAERLGNRWERMASKVLERVGKDTDSTEGQPPKTSR